MSQYHEIQRLRRLSDLLHSDHEVFLLLREAGELWSPILTSVTDIARGAPSDFIPVIDGMIDQLRQHKPRVVFIALNDLRRKLAALAGNPTEMDPHFIPFLVLLERAEHKYDDFVNSRFSREHALGFVAVLFHLNTLIEGAKEVLVVAVGEPREELPSDVGTIELFLEHSETVDDIKEKLTAISAMYSDTARLFGVSEIEYPFRILNLAIGTWWLKAAGELGVIRFLRRIFVNPAQDARAAFTREGKIRSIPRKLDTARLLLELSDEMERRGIDPKRLRETAREAAEKLADSYARLVADEEYIEVDGLPLSLPATEKPKLLAPPEPKQLDSGRNDAGPVNPGEVDLE